MDLKHILNEAETAHRQGNLSLAEEKYLQAINSYDNNDALYGLATLYSTQKRYDDAIVLFKKVSLREPQASDIALNYSLCLHAANKWEDALVIIKTIKQHLPHDIYIINGFSRLASSIKAPDLAIEILTKYPLNDVTSLSLLASTYMQIEHWIKAKSIWQQLKIPLSNNAQFYQSYSVCLANLRDYQPAIDAYEKFISLSKQDSNYHIKFADLYILARNIKLAREQLDIAIRLKNKGLKRYEIEIRICRLEHNSEQAIISADEALKLNPYCYIAWSAKQEMAHQYDETINALAHLLDNEIENTYENQQNLFSLAKAYERKTEYCIAFKCFKKANDLQTQVLKTSEQVFDEDKVAKVFSSYRNVMSTVQPLKPSKSKNIFIVGMPRSGTTLMDRIFSQHEQIESSGENEALALYIENKINHNLESKSVSWDDFFQKHSEDFQQSYFKKTDINSDIICDKMPHNFRYVGAMLSIFNGVKVIQMRRKPEDLALSIFSQPFAPLHNYAANLSSIAHTIFHANKLMDFWKETFSENVIDVCYEDLAKNPGDISKNIFEFCNLQWKNEYLNFHDKHVTSFTFSELQVRNPINTGKINFARHYKDELAEFRKIYASLI